MLMQILGGSESDLLHWIWCIQAWQSTLASHDMRDGSGEFVCWADLDPTRGRSRVSIKFNFKGCGTTSPTMPWAGCSVAIAAALHGDLFRGRMSRIGRQLSHRDWVSIEDEVERIQQVTMEDLHEIFENGPLSSSGGAIETSLTSSGVLLPHSMATKAALVPPLSWLDRGTVGRVQQVSTVRWNPDQSGQGNFHADGDRIVIDRQGFAERLIFNSDAKTLRHGGNLTFCCTRQSP